MQKELDDEMKLSNKLLYIAVLTFLVSSFMWYSQVGAPSSKQKPLVGMAYDDGESYVRRNISSTAIEPNANVDVTLSVRALHSDQIYGIEETIPSGFSILDNGGASHTDSNTLKWLYYSNTTPAPNVDYTYTLQAPASEGEYTFTGNYIFESTPGNDTDEIIGETTLNIVPPNYPPTVNLISPSADAIIITDNVTFECSADDLDEVTSISLYTNYFGNWSEMTTNASSGLTHTVAGLAAGTFTWNCYACDESAQCAWAANNRSFRVAECGDGVCDSDESCSTCAADCGSCNSPGGGGGGGGGGSPSRTDPLMLEFEFGHEIYSIKTESYISGLSIGATELEAVPQVPSKPVYKYFQLTANKDFDKATVKFKVPKQWYVDNNMNKLTTTLMRYSGTEWEMLVTQKESEDYDNLYFISTATQFSPFAIVADENPLLPEPDTQPTAPLPPSPPPQHETPTPPRMAGINTSSGNTSDNQSQAGNTSDGSGFFGSLWAYLSIASGLFIVIFLIILVVSKQRHDELKKAGEELNSIAKHGQESQANQEVSDTERSLSIKDEEKIESEAQTLSQDARKLDERLEAYVKECKQKGFGPEQIENSLKEAGWHAEDVKESLKREFE